MDWRTYTIEDTQRTLELLRSSKQGLTKKEALVRLKEYGKNSIDESEHFLWRVLRRRFSSLLLWVLLMVAAITFFLGNNFEALLIIIFLILNASLEIYQEFHSEKAAELLKHYLVPEARVIREGVSETVKTYTLVPGDIIELRAGDRIPADVRFLEIEGFAVDESVMTGESLSVAKTAGMAKSVATNLFEVTNCGFAGTSVTNGKAVAVVVSTGENTALGDVAHLTALAEKETTFEKHVKDFSRFLVKLLLFALALVFFLYFVVHGQSASLLNMLVFTLVLAITVVPEALPAITTVALTRGSLALARRKVIVKRLSAIEDLGSIEILCTDKTGTLTENKLQVTRVFGENKKAVLESALYATQVVPSEAEDLHDAFDKALYEEAPQNLRSACHQVKRLGEIPFNPQTRINAVIVEQDNETVLIVRGAPEEVLAKVSMEAYTRKQLAEWVKEAGLRGERVLAIATKKNHHKSQGIHITGNLEFQGLIAFLDPLKESARETILEAEALGVKVKIFSGDSREVVGAVSYAAGLLVDASQVVTGAEFENMSLPEQIHVLETQSAFARFSPAQKYAALQLLQKSHTVGFLGEGINDAPALKLAHVAMVVEGASDIAREASDILLLHKDLRVIIDGVREGRKVFANILKYLKITLAANFGNFYSVALATLFLPFLPLLPLQILLLNLLSDFPMLAIATDRVDHEKLERPNMHNMSNIVVTATLFGAISSFFDLAIFQIFSHSNQSTLQTAWFIFSLLAEVALLYSLRTRRWFFRGARSSFWVAALSVVVISIGFVLPYTALGTLLSFTPLPLTTLAFLVALLGVYFAVTEVLKHWYYQHLPTTIAKR